MLLAAAGAFGAESVLENAALRVELQTPGLAIQLTDKKTGVAWALGGPHVVLTDKRTLPVRLSGEIRATADTLSYSTLEGFEFRLVLSDAPAALEYSFRGVFQPFGAPEMDEVVLFRDSLEVGPGADDYYALAARLGIQLRPEGEKPFSRRMPAFSTGRGYSMSMMGAVRSGSALLVSWDSIDTDVLIEYSGSPRRTLTAGLAMRAKARSARLQPLGAGGYVEIAKAYREVARKRGLLQTIAEKLARNPNAGRLIGAADFKPFTLYNWVPNTPYNKTNQLRIQSNFTFDEVAQLAEHFRKDLGVDRAMLVVGGWINGGYDGKHPDILPAAGESGGNEGLAALSRRVKALGYVFGLHDNYTDFYRDAPSWNEDFIAKGLDGTLMKGGVWAGGPAYLICLRKSLELARRPQNMPAVVRLFSPDLYFIDVLYATPPRVCQDPAHPVTKVEDVQLKLDLADYARNQGMLFGSEEGNETGVTHGEYFEGLLGHKTRSHSAGADTVIPLFELVFGDAVPLFTHQSERLGPDNPLQFLDHILYAEMPVYRFGVHRYWLDPAQDFQPPEGARERMVFARGEKWGLYDRFIKNSYEVLSHLNRLTATLPMTDHRFRTPDRLVETTRFGSDVEITVNYGAADFALDNAVLPQYGFLVRSPTLLAFFARRFGNVTYEDPPLIVARPQDGQPLATSKRVFVYRGFGDGRLDLGGRIVEVAGTEQWLPGR